ncbi:uncharacterized protein F4812DRAFT_457317 [Daldinia caldariorum]|uniref:uncharacterized protein n=1 Tax=Daldinia caldariorum TaxID=326644 RepID=UPI002007F26B|nr:uncharacterized protein F4812DRAFT_457317 [Daldinia caldariorum]KAI1469918.1 hypothetical protein F4812DRAFT_457317 [Daldinia caldariorum]
MGAIPKPPKGHFNVLYFASASSFTSKEFDTFPAPLPLQKLFDVLEEKYSGIKDKILSSCLVTVNLNYVDISGSGGDESPENVIKEGDEVAIIPPSYSYAFHQPGLFPLHTIPSNKSLDPKHRQRHEQHKKTNVDATERSEDSVMRAHVLVLRRREEWNPFGIGDACPGLRG